MDVGGTTSDGCGADVAAMPLRELIRSEDTVLDNSLRRLIAAVDRPAEKYSAFDSAVAKVSAGEIV